MTDYVLEPLFVEGVNVPQGSKKAWLNPTTQRVMMREDQGNRHANRRAQVTSMARQHMADHGLVKPHPGPVSVRITFHKLRSASDYGSGKNLQVLKPSAPEFPAKAPDIDKLARLILDSLTGVVYVDDGQVVRLGCEKVWTDRFTGREGVTIYVKFLSQPEIAE